MKVQRDSDELLRVKTEHFLYNCNCTRHESVGSCLLCLHGGRKTKDVRNKMPLRNECMFYIYGNAM